MKIEISIQEIAAIKNWFNDRCFECCRKYNGRPWMQDCDRCKIAKIYEDKVMEVQKKEYEEKED